MDQNKPRSRHRIIKRSLAILGVLAVIVIGTHLWYVQNARSVLKNYIWDQSGGKIKLELSELSLNLFTKRLQIHKADLLSTDSLNQPITYHVRFSKLSVKVYSIWGLLFQKKLLIDSIKLYDPVIHVMQWRKDTSETELKDELSIPQEMGKVYNSLLDALNEFGVRRIVIDNAAISLINKTITESDPVTVSNIFFDLSRTPVKKGKKVSYLKDKQTIELRTFNQSILLPGGRHRLAFKSFNLQLFREKIELDSCTVTAIATDSSQSNYTLFFKKLFLAGVDFTAMSTKNVLKADTVYCDNPFFKINLYPQDAVKKKTELPDPDKIIRALTGNLDLAFVGVKDAGIDFRIYGKTKLSFFNAHRDNFEIHQFRINPDSSEAVSMKRFNMTLRGYRLFNEDSATRFSFDSLRFADNNVVLNNFAMLSRSGKNKIRNTIGVRVPLFELSGLNWYKLFFDEELVASQAILNDPIIHYEKKIQNKKGKRTDLFAALLDVDSLVGLENIIIKNGQVNMNLGQKTSFNIQNLDFNILSNQFLYATNKEGLRGSIQYLHFNNGLLHLKDFTAQMHAVRFTGNNLLYADEMMIASKTNKTSATINQVFIDNFQIDDNAENLEADGLQWQSASVHIHTPSPGNGARKNNRSSILIKNVEGNSTQLTVLNNTRNISAYIHSLKAASLFKNADEPLRTEGFYLAGNTLSVTSKTLTLGADTYTLSGSESSSLSGVSVRQIKNEDSLFIQAPRMSFSADLNDLIANNLHFTDVTATAPVIRLVKRDTATAVQNSTSAQPAIRIDQLLASAPDIFIATYRNDSVSRINIPSSENGRVKSSGIFINSNGLQVETLEVLASAATYTSPSGKITGVENGKIAMSLSDIRLGRNNAAGTWSGTVNSLELENAKDMGLGTKNGLYFQKASLGNLTLSSDYLPDLGRIMRANIYAWLHIPQAYFVNSNTTIKWFNANYSNSSKTLSLDSFIYHPTQPIDSVLAHAPYQLDYITLKTGKLTISGLDVERFKSDSSIIADKITIAEPFLQISRDKEPPNAPFPKLKPLPVDIIKHIAFPVAIKSIQIDDGTISYAEKDGISRKEGVLVLAHVNATIGNIKNRNLNSTDSLSLLFETRLMDSAQITLHLKQSYLDSLGSFVIKTKVSSADLSVINPFVVPVANVKVASGVLDSVSFQAVANEDYALGAMHLHYHDLRIKLVKDGDPDKSTFKQDVLTFLANTFVVKKNNDKRTGVIYYQHLGHQSFINYIVQLTLSGLSSSVGIKSNRKLLKQYNRDVRNKMLNPDTK